MELTKVKGVALIANIMMMVDGAVGKKYNVLITMLQFVKLILISIYLSN